MLNKCCKWSALLTCLGILAGSLRPTAAIAGLQFEYSSGGVTESVYDTGQCSAYRFENRTGELVRVIVTVGESDNQPLDKEYGTIPPNSTVTYMRTAIEDRYLGNLHVISMDFSPPADAWDDAVWFAACFSVQPEKDCCNGATFEGKDCPTWSRE